MQGPEKILRTLQAQLPEDVPRYVVGFSGGLDSTVLLHALKRVATRPLLAVHVNHGLHPDAGEWAAHCAALCREWQIACEMPEVEIDSDGEGLEAAARRARYAALQSCMQTGDVLLTGHHQRDQAETLLLQLLRGAGAPGMAAMPVRQRFADGWLLRPLLGLSRESLRAYAQGQGLQWLEDPGNRDESLDRNFLRARVMPQLRERWPAVDRLLARAAGHSAEAAVLLDELAAEDMTGCAGPARDTLSVSALRRLSTARRANLLRHWLRRHRLAAPSALQLQRIDRDLLGAREDAQPLFEQPGYELRRYRDTLFLLPQLPAAPGAAILNWDGQGELQLPPGCGRLRAEPAQQGAAGLLPGPLEVRFMRGGECIRPLGSRHHRRLKTLFQEAGTPPWVRRRMPLIYHGRELVAVADAWLSADHLQPGAESGWRPQWLDAPPGWRSRKQQ